jgi:hypothetical protein
MPRRADNHFMRLAELILQILTVTGVAAYTILTYRLLSAQTQQGFENKFFQLLRFHHDIVNAIEWISPVGRVISGRSAFKALYNEFYLHYSQQYDKNQQVPSDRLPGELYALFYDNNQALLGHYFLNLYHLIKFIDRAEIDPDEKMFYAHLVRARLSGGEHLLLFYNCISFHGRSKFYPLVVKHALLENMPQDELISRKLKHALDHKSLYPLRAYGES